jgi:hypothetical protein
MFMNRRTFAVLAVCLCVSGSAFAGGGGTKKDATITVKNDTAASIGVAVDPTAALLAAATPAAFQAAGGQIVNPGDTATFKVKAGAHRVIAVDAAGAGLGDVNVAVAKGGTKAGIVGAAGLAFP